MNQLLITLAFLLCLIDPVMGQTSWIGTTDTKWSKDYNWTSGAPDENTNAIIGDAAFTGSFQPVLDKNSECRNLTIGDGVKVSSLEVQKNLDVYGDIIIGANGTITANKGKTITLEGDWTNNGVYNATNNGARVTFSGNTQTLTGATTFKNVYINANSELTLARNMTVTRDIRVHGTLNPTASYTLAGTGDVDVRSTGTLKVFTSTFSANYPISGTFDLDKRSTVDYASAVTTQYISDSFEYGVLRISGGSTKELNANLPALQDGNNNAGIIYLDAGILDLKSYVANRDIGSGGYVVLAAGTTLRIGDGSEFPQNFDTQTIAGTSTVEYYGNNQDIEDVDYGNLILTGITGSVVKTMPTSSLTVFGDFTATVGTASSLTFTAQENIEVKKDFSLGAGVTFNASSYTHTFRGDWTNSGTINGGTSKCDMRGPSALISGTGTNNFYDLRFRAAGITAQGSTTINLSDDVTFLDGGSFRHSDGGVFNITGGSAFINANGIDLYDLNVTGTVTTLSNLEIRGDFDCDGSISALDGTISLNGASKTIDGTGTIDLYRVDVNGDITTESDIVIKNDLNVAVSGSFSASAGIVSFDGTSNLSGTADLFRSTINSGNSLTLGSNSELRIKNSLTINGTLDCSSHTPNSVNYCGSGSQTVVDNTYYNLYLSTGGVKTAASNFTVLGDLVIGSGATFAGSSREIQIYKDWTNNGSFAAGTSDIQFVSNNISNLTGTTTFNDFTVNKSSDETEVFLKSDMTASNIIMTTGLLDTESNSITTTSGRSGNGIIHGTVVHQHSFTNGTPYYFEGPNNSLTFTSPSGITSVSVDCRPQEITDFINDKEAVYREYDISINGGSYTDATWRLHYEDNELNAFEEPFLTFYRHDTGTLWDSLGFTSRDQVNNWVELVGETDAEGRFALSGTRREVEWNGSVSSDWHDASNWTTISGTDMSNRVPTSEDAVEIGISNFTNQPSLTTKESIASLTLGSAKAVTITLSDTLHVVGNVRGQWSSDRSHTIDVGSSVLEIDQSFTMSDGTNGRDISISIGSGEVHIANDLIQTGAADITFTGAGNLKVNGDYSFISGNFTAGSGTMTYSGSKRQDVAALTYNNLSLTKSNETAQVNLPTVVNGNLILTSGGRLLCNDSLTVTGDINIGAGTTILEDNSHIILSGDWINDGVFSPSTGSVRFTGTSNQSVDSTLFSNIIIDKSAGSVSLSNHIFLEGDLSLLNGTFDLSTYQANRTNSGGTLTLGSGTTIKLGGADNFPKVFVNNTIDANATVEYNGTMAQTVLPGIDYGHLSFDNGSSNAKQVLEDVTVSGDLTISDDATLYLDAVELVLEGNLDNQGTIDPTQSLLTLNGSSKTITGPVNLHSLDVNGSYTVATGTTNMTGDFYVETTGSIDFGNNDAVLDGNLTNKGSIISNGTATFTGTQVQTIQLLNAISSSSTGVINFNGTVAPFISSTSSPNFATVNINNTGGITPSVPWNVFVACNIASGASFNGGPLTHTFYGDFDNQGSVTSSGDLVFMPGAPYSASATIALGGTSFTSSGDVVFAGTAPITLTSGTTPTFQHITISNQDPSGVTAPQSWTVSDEILVNSGAILNGGVATLHNIGTSLLVNGTLEGGTSRFSFTGATSSIDGIGTTNFNDLDIDPGATLTLNKDISLTGDFVNDGTFSPAGRNVRFTGSSQSAITGITGSVTFGDLEIDKTSTDVVLNVPVDVVDQLTLTDGIITTTTTNILTIRDNGVSDEGSSTSYVEGPMKKIGDDAFVFPLGDGGKWARLGITAPSSTTDEFRAEFIDVAYSDTTSMATSPTPVLNNVSQHEYWELDRLVGSSSVSVELFWENAAASGINDFSDDLVIAHWTGSDWENVGQSSISGGNIGSVTSDPVSSFSPFTFGSKSPSTNPLPIELVAFDAILEGGRVIITWTTASEINNDYFTIERSKDGRDWEIVNEVPGAGFSSGLLHYEDIDIMPYSGLSYYRLKQTDFDGSFEYSDIRAVYNGLTESLEMKVYPNPTNGVVNIIADVENISGFTVSTLLGRDVSAEVDLIESSSSVHRIDLSNLSSGIYILKFETSAVKIHKH